MKASISQIGPYRIEEKIGSGGMAAVYRAVREGIEGFERPVALKVLHPHLAEDDEYVEMFHSEARLAARLAHSALVPVTDLGVVEGTHFMAMDLLIGITLADLFQRFRKKKRRFPRGHGLYVMAEALDGLHYAHELTEDGKPCEVVHRDLSPRNIVITRSGAVRLLDFGIARSTSRRGQTAVGIVKGTVPYMAPEQARGEALDRTADIFAAGVVLYQLLTGKAPIADGRTEAQRRALACMEVTPKLKRIHVAVRPIVAKALQTRPEDRYQTAHEMAEDLRTARATLEPEHDPALLAAMVSRAVKRRDRVEGTSDVKKSSAARPSTAARQKRAKSVMRKPRPDESAAQQPPARPPLPELLPWDSARTFTLLAALITLLGLCYTFIPLGV